MTSVSEHSLTFVETPLPLGKDHHVSMEIGTDEKPKHFHADLGDHVGTRLNWLRAAVLG